MVADVAFSLNGSFLSSLIAFCHTLDVRPSSHSRIPAASLPFDFVLFFVFQLPRFKAGGRRLADETDRFLQSCALWDLTSFFPLDGISDAGTSAAPICVRFYFSFGPSALGSFVFCFVFT